MNVATVPPAGFLPTTAPPGDGGGGTGPLADVAALAPVPLDSLAWFLVVSSLFPLIPLNLVIIYMLYASVRARKGLHANSRVLAYYLFATLVVFVVGHTMAVVPYAVVQVVPLPAGSAALAIYTIGMYLEAYGANMLGPLFILICVERTCATVLLEKYEQANYRSISILGLLLANLGTIFFLYCIYTNFLSFNVRSVFYSSLDACAFLYSFVLLHINRCLSRREMAVAINYQRNTNNRLSRRYQLSENVRLTASSYPALFVMTVMNGLNFVLLVRLTSNPATTRHAILVYAAVFELQVLVSLLLLSRSWWLEKIAQCLSFSNSGSRVGVSGNGGEAEAGVLKAIRMQLGGRNAPTDTDHHFLSMQKQWKTHLPPLSQALLDSLAAERGGAGGPTGR